VVAGVAAAAEGAAAGAVAAEAWPVCVEEAGAEILGCVPVEAEAGAAAAGVEAVPRPENRIRGPERRGKGFGPRLRLFSRTFRDEDELIFSLLWAA
jgi:hypothetical protein